MDNREVYKGNKNKVKIFEYAKLIYKKDGIKGFYCGLKADLVRVLP